MIVVIPFSLCTKPISIPNKVFFESNWPRSTFRSSVETILLSAVFAQTFLFSAYKVCQTCPTCRQFYITGTLNPCVSGGMTGAGCHCKSSFDKLCLMPLIPQDHFFPPANRSLQLRADISNEKYTWRRSDVGSGGSDLPGTLISAVFSRPKKWDTIIFVKTAHHTI